MRYQTGNPVEPNGSSDPRDLFDNAANLDLATNADDPLWLDRLGKSRKSWAGMEQDFNSFLQNTQFEYPPLVYVDGTPLTVDRPTQVISRSGQLYRVRLPASFPVALSGTWATDAPLLNPTSDATLRQDLGNTTDASLGAAGVGRGDQVVNSIADLRALLKSSPSKYATVCGYYAAGDGGFAFYYLDAADTTSTDNGGTVIVASDGGRWKLNHNGSVSIKQFGARGNWNGSTGADDTLAVKAAVASGVRRLIVPAVPAGFAYRLTSPVNISAGVTVEGLGVSPYASQGSGTSANTRGSGSWFHLDHAGIGFNVSNTAAFGAVQFLRLGTFRTHSIPGGVTVFTPTVYDFDFVFSKADDSSMDDVCLLNAYRGVKVDDSRVWLNKIYGQPLAMGIRVDLSYDICRITNIHWWPYWAMVQKVWAWTQANGTGFQTSRSDNHMYENIFTIFYNCGMRVIGTSGVGTANKLKLVNADFDRGFNGLVIDGSANGATMQVVNLTTQGENGTVGSNVGISVYANQVEIDFANLDVRTFNSYGILVNADYCNIGINGLYMADWGLDGGGATPIAVINALSNMRITGMKRFFRSPDPGTRYSGNGTIRTELAQGRSTATTNSSGDVVVTIMGNASPNAVNITVNSNVALSWSIVGRTTTTFTVRFYTASGTPLTNTAVDFNYECHL